MSLTDLSTVLNILPRLDVSELLQVKNKASASLSLSTLANSSSGLPSGQDEPMDYLLDGIQVELRRRGLLGRDMKLQAKVIPGTYGLAAIDVKKLLEEHVGRLSAAEYALLGQLSIRCLAKYLENRGVPISAKSLCQAISKIPQALDDSYPGYLQAGLLPFALRK